MISRTGAETQPGLHLFPSIFSRLETKPRLNGRMGDGPAALGIPGGALHAGAGFLQVKVGSTGDKLHTPHSPAAALGGMLA